MATDSAPAKKHYFTDVGCSCVFITYCVGLLMLFFYSHKHGNIKKLTQGFDWKGRICGVDEGVVDKPYLYWCVQPDTSGIEDALAIQSGGIPSGIPSMPTLQLMDGICVQTCPNSIETQHQCPGKPEITSDSTPGDDGTETMEFTYKRTLQNESDVPTIHLMGAYCLPTTSPELMDTIMNMTGANGDTTKQLFETVQGVYDNKELLIGITIGAFIFGYLYLLLLYFAVKPLVITSLILSNVILFLLGLLCSFMSLSGFRTVANGAGEREKHFLRRILFHYVPEAVKEKILDDPVVVAIIAGVIIVLWLLYTCIIFCARKKIGLICDAIKETSSTIMLMPSLLAVPVMQIVFVLITLAMMLFGLAWVCSVAEVQTMDPVVSALESGSSALGVTGVQRTLVFTDQQKLMILYFVFGVIWVKEVVNALGQFVISHAVIQRRTKNTCFPLFQGYASGMFFHLGSIAFGGFIVGLLGFISLILKFISSQSKAATSGAANPVAIIAGCCSCCVDCVEHIMRLVNQMVYVDICLNGTSYCISSYHVVKCYARNAASVGLFLAVASGVKYMGLLTIGGLSTFVAWELLNDPQVLTSAIESGSGVLPPNVQDQLEGVTGDALRASNVTGGTVAAGIISFLVASIFMNVVEMTACATAYYDLWKADLDDVDIKAKSGGTDKDYQLLV